MNGADERGSRPIANDTDKAYTIDVSNSSNLGKFYGWPDFYGNAEPVTDPKFKSPRGKEPFTVFDTKSSSSRKAIWSPSRKCGSNPSCNK